MFHMGIANKRNCGRNTFSGKRTPEIEFIRFQLRYLFSAIILCHRARGTWDYIYNISRSFGYAFYKNRWNWTCYFQYLQKNRRNQKSWNNKEDINTDESPSMLLGKAWNTTTAITAITLRPSVSGRYFKGVFYLWNVGIRNNPALQKT